jgi:hypothetical protein
MAKVPEKAEQNRQILDGVVAARQRQNKIAETTLPNYGYLYITNKKSIPVS